MRWRAQACRGIGVARNRARPARRDARAKRLQKPPEDERRPPCANAQARLPRRIRQGREQNRAPAEPVRHGAPDRVENAMAARPSAKVDCASASERPSAAFTAGITADKCGSPAGRSGNRGERQRKGWAGLARHCDLRGWHGRRPPLACLADKRAPQAKPQPL